jgi:hypothetical protein
VHFKLSAASGEVVDEGEGTVAVQGRVVTVAPQLGQPLRLGPEQIAEVTEPVPYTVRIALSDGSQVELSQLGPLRSQLLTQIGDIRVVGARRGLVTIGFGERQRFHGAVDGVEAEISLHDDGLVAIPQSGLPVQVPYAVVEDVTTDPSGYRITVAMGDAGQVTVQRLAQMTSQFLSLLRERVTGARGRTGAFLQALLPGLGPLAQRQLAADLRDGLAAPRATLDAIDPKLWPDLVGRAVLPERAAAAELVQGLGEHGLGFHQTRSVEVAAQGTFATPEAAPVESSGPGRGNSGFDTDQMMRGMTGMVMGQMMGVPPPGAGGSGPLLNPGGGAGMGMAGGMGVPGMGMGAMGGMGMGFGSPFAGGLGGLLAMRLLRGDRSWGSGGEQQARSMFRVPDAPSAPGGAEDGQGLVPAHTAFGRLGLGGDHPTIVAFLLARTAQGALLYEPLNIGDHATYVFHDPELSLRQLNLALLLMAFRVQIFAGDVTGLDSRYAEAVRQLPHLTRLAAAYRGRAIHDERWEAQLRPLLT